MRIKELTKRALSGALAFVLAAVALTGIAVAQVPSTQQPPFQPSTFTAAFAVTPGAVTAGDIACIYGSASRLIKIKKVRIGGLANTTAQTSTLALVKRSAVNTGGTSTAPTGVPLDSQQVVTTATATVAAYTAVPTPGTAVGNIGETTVNFVTSGASTSTIWDYTLTSNYSDVRLRGVAQGVCINAPNAFTTNAPTLDVEVTWTEQ